MLRANVYGDVWNVFFFFQAEDGIRDLVRSRGLGDVYKRQEQDMRAFIDALDVAADVKERLHKLSPHNYTGIDLLGRVMP